MTGRLYCAVDFDEQGGRVAVGGLREGQLEIVMREEFAHPLIYLDGRTYWNVLGLWEELQSALENVGRQFGDQVKSLSLCGPGADYVLLSPKGDLLGWPMHGASEPSLRMRSAIRNHIAAGDFFAESGQLCDASRTLCQLMDDPLLPHLEALEAKLLLLPDFLNWALCGSRVSEVTNASTTQLWQPWKKAWSESLIEECELPRRVLPEVVAPGTTLGQLREEVAERTGLARIDVIATATNREAARTVALPHVDTETSATYLFRTYDNKWQVGLEVPAPVVSPDRLQPKFHNLSGAEGCRIEPPTQLHDRWRLLMNAFADKPEEEAKFIHEAEEVTADFLPLPLDFTEDYTAEEFVTWIRSRCAKLQIQVPQSEGELLRCVADGFCASIKTDLDSLVESAGITRGPLYLVSSENEPQFLKQCLADAIEQSVISVDSSASLIGTLLMQAMAAGELATLGEIREVAATSFTNDVTRHSRESGNPV
ncbi:rhamnulokinase [Calycomorphotria hydatis]|uniref:Rhamnulokinase n=1 Tax=Calycomorphotria hydatis TaxID=2528027 RepID=A0A517T3H5_9PLAN|nr:FGGY family carbohydrate kinase [Calycomorphotria hydatis]QDT62926.1 Rhamnulokinase [Calycomorphotria hydatis]